MDRVTQVFNEALTALNNRDLNKAKERFGDVLQLDGAHVPALNLLTVVLMSLNRFAEAEPLIAKAVRLNPNSDVSFYNYGLISKQLNKPRQALEAFNKALAINRSVAETWNNRGTVFSDLKKYDAAIGDFEQAIRLNPGYAEAYVNRGKASGRLKQTEAAFVAYDKALSLKPDLVEAWLGRGDVFFDLGRHSEALAAYDRAVSIKPDLAEAWLHRGNALASLKRHDEAFAAYDKADSLKIGLAEAWLGRGNVYAELKRCDEALAAYEKALSIKPDLAEVWLGRGNIFGALKRDADAHAAYDRALSVRPDLAEAWLGRGNVFADRKRYDEAQAAYDKALSIKTDLAYAWLGRGNAFTGMKRADAALAAYDRALSIKPDLAEAWLGRGNVLADRRRHDEALATYDRALSITSDLESAWIGRGNMLTGLRRHDDAFAAYDKALSINPRATEAWLGRGHALADGQRYVEALVAYDEALLIAPASENAWIGRGNVLCSSMRYDEALAAYDEALAIMPEAAEAWLGRGNVDYRFNRQDEALAAYDKALSIKADVAEAWIGRGNIFHNLRRHGEALAAYDEALAIKPDLAEAWLGRGNLLVEFKRYTEALSAFDKAMTLTPSLDYAEGAHVHTKLQLCDWTDIDRKIDSVLSAVRDRKRLSAPFVLLSLPSSPADQLRCAQSYAQDVVGSPSEWPGGVYSHERIRVAYLSGDFHDHPVSRCAVGLLEHHDKSRFEVAGLSFGPDETSAMRERLKGAFEHFIDVREKSDQDIVDLMRRMEIDIAVDLMGYTQGFRPGIFAARPAPIQVNYLGYLATMGAPFIDYIMADRVVLPPEHEQHYAEKIVRLPECFLIGDRQVAIAPGQMTRQDAGLPPEGFVFCSFNNTYKLLRPTFDAWMRVLREVDGSVLWLLKPNEETAANLQREAQRCGVDGDRIIFAPRLDFSEHLARQRLADLFLDTTPYNGGATALAALWSGLPILTVLGETIVGRMAASMLHAIGLPELVTATLPDYEAMAIRVAGDPSLYTALYERLACQRTTCPLFDPQRFAQHVESAYQTMWKAHQLRRAPVSFSVPLGQYQEVGVN